MGPAARGGAAAPIAGGLEEQSPARGLTQQGKPLGRSCSRGMAASMEAVGRSPSRARRPIVLALVLVLLVALMLRLGPRPPAAGDPVHRLMGADAVQATLWGRLLEDPRLAPPGTERRSGGAGGTAASRGCKVLLQLEEGRSELAFARCPPLRQGWRVRATGSLMRLRAAPHPFLAGPAERLEGQGVRTRLQVQELHVLARPPTPILDLRHRIADRLIEAAGEERGGLLAALVLGSAVVPVPPEVREAFRASGLSHALAASGFHLTVLLGVVTALGRPLGRVSRLALAGGAMVAFLLLAGPQGSVVRAVLMGAVALLALESGRRARPLPLLLATVVTMLWIQPAWLRDVGFQLSVVATAGLLITATPLEETIARRLPEGRDGQPGWARRILAPALAVPLAASLWTLPLQLLHFGVVPLYAVPANLAAGPLLTPLTLAAMAMAAMALLAPGLLGLMVLVVGPLARLLLAIARGFSGLPMAQWQTGRPMPLLVGVFALALLPLLLPAVRGRIRLAGLLLLILVAVLHGAELRADQLLLVHQAGGAGGGRDLLLARHDGRGALISTRSDGYSCSQARRLSSSLGMAKLDWLLLLDPVGAEDPACWQRQAALVVAYGDGSTPLAAGERLHSPGLAVQALTMDSHALDLRLGRQRWLLLPDRQAHQAWRHLGLQAPQGVWLGFRPAEGERMGLQRSSVALRWGWWSGSAGGRGLEPPWHASGDSGSLLASGG